MIIGAIPPHSVSIEDVLSDPDLQTVDAVKNCPVKSATEHQSVEMNAQFVKNLCESVLREGSV